MGEGQGQGECKRDGRLMVMVYNLMIWMKACFFFFCTISIVTHIWLWYNLQITGIQLVIAESPDVKLAPEYSSLQINRNACQLLQKSRVLLSWLRTISLTEIYRYSDPEQASVFPFP